MDSFRIYSDKVSEECSVVVSWFLVGLNRVGKSGKQNHYYDYMLVLKLQNITNFYEKV